MAVYAFKQNNDISQPCRLVVRSWRESSHGSIRIHPSSLTINDCFVLFGLHITPSFSNFFSALSEWVSNRSIWWYDRRLCFRTFLRAIEHCFRSVLHQFQIEFPLISLAVRLIFMGNSLLEIKPQRIDPWISSTMSTFPSRVARQVVDQDNAGDVYILVFKGDVPIRKMAHHALLIDVAGRTDDSYFSGVLLHLTANALDCQTEFLIDDRPWKRNLFYESFYIGKTVPANYVHMSQPRKWAIALQELVSETFPAESTCNRKVIHSRVMTCAINWSMNKAARRGRRNWIVRSLSKPCYNILVSNGRHSCPSSRITWLQWSSICLSDSFLVKRTNYSSRNKWTRKVQMRCLHDQWLLSHWINVLSTWSSVSPSFAPIWLQTQCWTKAALIERRWFF